MTRVAVCVCVCVCVCVWRLSLFLNEQPLPKDTVSEAVTSVGDDLDLIRQCLLSAEELVVGKAQRWPFPRGEWLQAVRSASNVDEMLTVIKGYEAPLISEAFEWDKLGYGAWMRRTCATIPELARYLAELQLHIRDQAMGPDWMGLKRDFFATLNGVAKSTTPAGIEASQVASVDDICKPWKLVQMQELTAYITRVADQGARKLPMFAMRDVGVNDRGELANFPSIRNEPLPLLRCGSNWARVRATLCCALTLLWCCGRGKFAVLKVFNGMSSELLALVDTSPRFMKSDYVRWPRCSRMRCVVVCSQPHGVCSAPTSQLAPWIRRRGALATCSSASSGACSSQTKCRPWVACCPTCAYLCACATCPLLTTHAPWCYVTGSTACLCKTVACKRS